jgi:hypothetical protein
MSSPVLDPIFFARPYVFPSFLQDTRSPLRNARGYSSLNAKTNEQVTPSKSKISQSKSLNLSEKECPTLLKDLKTAHSGVKSHFCIKIHTTGGQLEKELSSVWLLYRVVFHSIRSGFQSPAGIVGTL